MIALILGTIAAIPALAGELPERPVPPELAETDCRQPAVWSPGKPVPSWAVDTEEWVATCGGQLLPTAMFLHYRNRAEWGDAVADLYRIDEAVWEHKLAERDAQIAELQAELAQPVPLFDRPSFNRAVGAGSMLLAVGAGILVVRAAAWDPLATP